MEQQYQEVKLGEAIESQNILGRTYNIIFNNSGGDYSLRLFWPDIRTCLNYIRANNGKGLGHFATYKGGKVYVKCNETREIIFRTNVI